MDKRPNALEVKALREALSGPEPWKRVLCGQVSGLVVTSRKNTVVGGFTNFRLAGDYPAAKIDLGEETYPAAADVTHPALSHGGAFIVWAEDGKISSLEYYVNGDEDWPKFDEAGLDAFGFAHQSDRSMPRGAMTRRTRDDRPPSQGMMLRRVAARWAGIPLMFASGIGITLCAAAYISNYPLLNKPWYFLFGIMFYLVNMFGFRLWKLRGS